MIALPKTALGNLLRSAPSIVNNACAAAIKTQAALPLSFEANLGQSDSRVLFISHGPHRTVFLLRDGLVMALGNPAPPKHTPISDSSKTPTRRAKIAHDLKSPVVGMRFLGLNSLTHVTGLDQLPARVNYFVGDDPANGVPASRHTNM